MASRIVGEPDAGSRPAETIADSRPAGDAGTGSRPAEAIADSRPDGEAVTVSRSAGDDGVKSPRAARASAAPAS